MDIVLYLFFFGAAESTVMIMQAALIEMEAACREAVAAAAALGEAISLARAVR